MSPSPPPPDDRDEVLAVLEAIRPKGAPWPPPDWLRLLFRGSDAPFPLITASARGASEAVPWLAAILDEDDLSLEDSPGGGHAPTWAALALHGLPGSEGLDALVRAVVRTEDGDGLRDAAMDVLADSGDAGVEAMIRGWEAYPVDSDERFTLIDLLAEWPKTHPRIREALIVTLAEDPQLGSELISACGDPELIEPLRALWDGCEVDEAHPKGPRNAVGREIGWALADVDTVWTDADDAKMSRFLELTGFDRHTEGDHPDGEALDDADDSEEQTYLKEDLRAILDDAGRLKRPDGAPVDDAGADVPITPLLRREAPGRNDLCWCGSGKKYKKCHLETDGAD